jgi:ribonuclease G
VLVPEALLDSVPDDWAGEDTGSLPLGAPADTGARRRGRGRGRGRDRDRPEETRAPDLAPQPVAVGPIILGRTDDDRERDRKEIRTERDYKEILINTGDRETRIAVLEAGKLVELHVEREERVVGNVCKGRVSNVLPGMDCAFVDIGLDRNAFLYVGDILYDEKDGDGGSVKRTSRDVKIKDLAKPGQEMLVQIVKGPRGTKGARVSTKMSIPGRYLVLMPEGDHLGVSRKVEDARERERLRRIADQLQPKGFGLIIRTEAEGRTEAELKQDLDYLVGTWAKIQEKTRRAHAPALIHKDLGIVLKTIRDLFGQDVDKLILDDREEYEKVVDTLTELSPDLVDRVLLHDDSEPLFTRYNLEEEIDRLLRRKVWLRNGAYLLIDTTEALTTIDVNTGKFVGTSSLAETILKTNMDAVEEIARQLRLRDIGGMIVLDFIDMASSRDRALVMRKLEEAFRKDRTRTKIAHISPLGLVEMTRKRTAENVTDVMTETCPYCQGRGRVWSAETMAIQIEREVLRLCAKQEVDAVLLYTNPEVAAWLIGAEGESVERLERIVRRPVYVRARHDFHIEKYEVLPGDMLELERDLFPYHGGHVVEAVVQKMDLITPPRSAAWADGYFVDLANGAKLDGQRTRVRLTDVRRSFAMGEPVAPASIVDRSEPM